MMDPSEVQHLSSGMTHSTERASPRANQLLQVEHNPEIRPSKCLNFRIKRMQSIMQRDVALAAEKKGTWPETVQTMQLLGPRDKVHWELHHSAWNQFWRQIQMTKLKS